MKDKQSIQMTVVYDNNPYDKRLELDWGLSCFIEGWIKEQSLILDTEKGLIVMTGCAHPRITKIIATAKELLKKDIYLALGGFHMAGFDKGEIKEIISKFRDLGVKKVGSCHCSGDDARKFFAEEYKDDFIKIGVGKKIKVQ